MANLTSSSSPSPPETHSLPPVDTTHTSPCVEAHVDDLNIRGSLSNTRTSALPPPPGTATSMLSGARDGVMNGDELDKTDSLGSPHASSPPPRMRADSGGHKLTTPDNTVRDIHLPALHIESPVNNSNLTSFIGGSSPFPLETINPLLVNTTHTSPHVEARADDLNISGSVSDTRTSSWPPPSGSHPIPATSMGTGILSGARDFVINNMMISARGDSNHDTVVQGIKTLFKNVIKGVEYDSSLRDPPPQCHPGTRVQLMEKILTWVRNGRQEKMLLWLSGPAGVGKSAVIQTVAESLAESKSVGATIFLSRLDDRNDPKRVFITLAFQLAIRIPAYRNYITERIVLDPSLLGKGVKEQFRIFITEPFGNDGMGKGEGPWAVLLDGLDECEGVTEQSRIVKLVSKFILRFPNAPLIWVIASQPEPHIVGTFKNKAVALSHWSEFVPIDSTQACKDVEHYLDASFKAMQELFPHLPSDWPSGSQFLELANGARGLFIFARTAVHFMEDPDYADPVSRLNSLLLIGDGLDTKVTNDR